MPDFTSSDDISYDVVAGITQNITAVGTSVTLHTRIGNYTLRFVNPKCADIFGALYREENQAFKWRA